MEMIVANYSMWYCNVAPSMRYVAIYATIQKMYTAIIYGISALPRV
jgi:hypothetical protein